MLGTRLEAERIIRRLDVMLEKITGRTREVVREMGHCNYLLPGKVLNLYCDKRLNISNLAVNKHIMKTI